MPRQPRLWVWGGIGGNLIRIFLGCSKRLGKRLIRNVMLGKGTRLLLLCVMMCGGGRMLWGIWISVVKEETVLISNILLLWINKNVNLFGRLYSLNNLWFCHKIFFLNSINYILLCICWLQANQIFLVKMWGNGKMIDSKISWISITSQFMWINYQIFN